MSSSALKDSQLVWLVTGASTGLGKALVHALLSRGDIIIATARSHSLPLLTHDFQDAIDRGVVAVRELDVTAPLERISELAEEVVRVWGRVDVVVNNAGYVLVGPIEECTPEETFAQFNTNLFGALNVARAFLPYMRQRKTGTVVWAGSVAGWVGLTYSGIYGASKWAMRGLSRSLHNEISPLGLRSICVDFGNFRTPILSGEKLVPGVRSGRDSDYAEVVKEGSGRFGSYDGAQPGDPTKAAEVLADLVHGTGVFSSSTPSPTSLVLGSDAFESVKEDLDLDVRNLARWKDVTLSTDFGRESV